MTALLLTSLLPPAGQAAPDFPALMDRLDSIRADAGVAGLVLVVADADGLVFAQGRGVEDWDSGKPMTPDSLIRIGSVTKAFTGLALAVGVVFWVFSSIKFQADMGILLTFMFLWNMIGALWLLPALARFLLKPAKA